MTRSPSGVPWTQGRAVEAVMAELGADPYVRIEQLRRAGRRKAQAEGVAYQLEHERKILLSRIAAELAREHHREGLSEARLERMARADPRYARHIAGTAEALQEREEATSEYFAIKSELEWDAHVLFHANALAKLER